MTSSIQSKYRTFKEWCYGVTNDVSNINFITFTTVQFNHVISNYH